jgi:hypothetical protein
VGDVGVIKIGVGNEVEIGEKKNHYDKRLEC